MLSSSLATRNVLKSSVDCARKLALPVKLSFTTDDISFLWMFFLVLDAMLEDIVMIVVTITALLGQTTSGLRYILS